MLGLFFAYDAESTGHNINVGGDIVVAEQSDVSVDERVDGSIGPVGFSEGVFVVILQETLELSLGQVLGQLESLVRVDTFNAEEDNN